MEEVRAESITCSCGETILEKYARNYGWRVSAGEPVCPECYRDYLCGDYSLRQLASGEYIQCWSPVLPLERWGGDL